MTKKNLHQLIAMNAMPLTRAAMMAMFGPNEATRTKIDKILNELSRENLIIADGKNSFRVAKPWADIAYATVGARKANGRTDVTLHNLPEDLAPAISMSRNDVHKNGLKEGDKIVVGLNRNTNGNPDLRARFIAHVKDGKNFRLTGVFNQKSRTFTPLDKNIKTEFRLSQEPADNTVPRQFIAEFPLSFDLRDPVIHVLDDQTRDMDTGQAISWIVTRKHDIAYTHPDDVLSEALKLNKKPVLLDNRVDLRDLDFVTVDPFGSTDLDDAIFARVENGGYAVYTAIADVPYIVPYKSTVDREAYRRGLTHYLADDHTVHMLPPVIATKKASLLPNTDRAAIVVKQILGLDFQLKGFEVFPAVIRSRAQLTYGSFYDLIDKRDKRFKVLTTIHDTRRRQGLDKDLAAFLSNSPDRYATKSIVETLMVQTNSLAAQFLHEAKVPFLSRNFEKTLAGHKDNTVQRAYYSSTSLGHAAIGLTHYAHMSSPIRRYADDVNERCLHRAMNTPDLGIQDEEIAAFDEICSHLNRRRATDRDVMHDINKFHAMPDLERLKATPISIAIQDIGNDYIDVLVIQRGLRQRIELSSLPANQWRIDTDKYQLVLTSQKGDEIRRYQRNDSILGQLYDVDPQRAQWKVTLTPSEATFRTTTTPAPGPG